MLDKGLVRINGHRATRDIVSIVNEGREREAMGFTWRLILDINDNPLMK